MDKNKIIEAAAKLIAKGAYDKAIKEYQKILDADPKDVRVLQKMAELFQRKNENDQAAEYFSKVAEAYASDGFFLKAVAQYKQVLKTNPNLSEVNLKLAELHQQLGLMSEAMAYYQVYANALDKAGNVKGSLDVLKKMVDLDPDNVASRIKLAELYARENMNPQASAEFKKAADYLKKVNRGDDYLRVAERLATLEPENVPLSRELAQSYLQKGDQKRALAKLQVCFKADPRDVETLVLLAQAFHALGQHSKTVSVYKELAKIAQDAGKNADAVRYWDQVASLDPNDADLLARKQANRPPSAAPARPAPPSAPAPAAPARPQAAAPAAPPSAPPKPPGGNAPPPAPAPAAAAPTAAPAAPGAPRKDQLQKLLTETDVYVKYGLHDKALEHLRRVFAVDPESLEAHEKAYQIYVGARHGPQAAEQLLNVLRLCTRRGDVERAQPYLDALLKQNPNHPEVPTFVSVLRPGSAAPVEEEVLGEDAIVVDAESPAELTVEPAEVLSDDLALDAAVSDGEEVVDEPEPSAHAALEDEPLVLEDEPLGATEGEIVVDPELEERPEDPTVTGTETYSLQEPEPEELALVDGGDELVEESVTLDEEPISDAGLEVVEDSRLAEAVTLQEPVLEEPSLVEEPVFSDPSDDVTEDGSSRTFTEQELPAVEAAPEPEPEPAPAAFAAPEDDPLAEECDEASFFLEQGELAEAREILETVVIASPGHPRATELLSRLDALEAQGATEHEAAPEEEIAPPAVEPIAEPAAAPESRDAFDLAAELADELGEVNEEAPAAAPAGNDYQVSVDEVFSEFKKGLAKVVKPEDVDTHYDLGIAYKEMGLTDDAIGEFNVARQGCLGKKKELDCLSMIGMMQLMRGDPAAAVQAFREALASELSVGDVAKALGYDLATAWEQAGAPGKALYRYQQVVAIDPGFRDVQAQVARLVGLALPEDDETGRGSGGNGSPQAASSARRPPSSTGVPAAQKPEAPAAPGTKSRKVGYL